MESTEKPPDIRVTGEASSLAVEWSHDVCSFLLKWLTGFPELNQLKSSEVSAEGTSVTGKSFGMYTELKLILQFMTGPEYFARAVS